MRKLVTLTILAFLVSSCWNHYDYGVDNKTFKKYGTVIVDTLLKNDTAYYHTYTLLVGSDSICHLRYTALLSSHQLFKATFTPTKAFEILYKEANSFAF